MCYSNLPNPTIVTAYDSLSITATQSYVDSTAQAFAYLLDGFVARAVSTSSPTSSSASVNSTSVFLSSLATITALPTSNTTGVLSQNVASNILSGGAIAGIAVGVIVGVLLLGLLLAFILARRRAARRGTPHNELDGAAAAAPDEPTDQKYVSEMGPKMSADEKRFGELHGSNVAEVSGGHTDYHGAAELDGTTTSGRY